MGVGRMWSPTTGWGNAKEVLAQNGLGLIEYKPKEVDRSDFTSIFHVYRIDLGIDHDDGDTIYYSFRS